MLRWETCAACELGAHRRALPPRTSGCEQLYPARNILRAAITRALRRRNTGARTGTTCETWWTPALVPLSLSYPAPNTDKVMSLGVPCTPQLPLTGWGTWGVLPCRMKIQANARGHVGYTQGAWGARGRTGVSWPVFLCSEKVASGSCGEVHRGF